MTTTMNQGSIVSTALIGAIHTIVGIGIILMIHSIMIITIRPEFLCVGEVDIIVHTIIMVIHLTGITTTITTAILMVIGMVIIVDDITTNMTITKITLTITMLVEATIIAAQEEVWLINLPEQITNNIQVADLLEIQVM